jgi:GAF domain
VTLSGKGARSRPRGRKAPSTKTKGRTRRAGRLQESRAELYQQLAEAREHQTATSDVLDIISTSPGELAPVFDAILSNATRICGAHFGTLFLTEGDAFRIVAMHNMPPAIAERRRRDPLVRPGQGSSLARMAQSKQLVQIPDITADPGYLERDPDRIALVELGGYRSILTVPMLRQPADRRSAAGSFICPAPSSARAAWPAPDCAYLRPSCLHGCNLKNQARTRRPQTNRKRARDQSRDPVNGHGGKRPGAGRPREWPAVQASRCRRKQPQPASCRWHTCCGSCAIRASRWAGVGRSYKSVPAARTRRVSAAGLASSRRRAPSIGERHRCTMKSVSAAAATYDLPARRRAG